MRQKKQQIEIEYPEINEIEHPKVTEIGQENQSTEEKQVQEIAI